MYLNFLFYYIDIYPFYKLELSVYVWFAVWYFLTTEHQNSSILVTQVAVGKLHVKLSEE